MPPQVRGRDRPQVPSRWGASHPKRRIESLMAAAEGSIQVEQHKERSPPRMRQRVSEGEESNPQPPPRDEIQLLWQEIRALRAENQALREKRIRERQEVPPPLPVAPATDAVSHPTPTDAPRVAGGVLN